MKGRPRRIDGTLILRGRFRILVLARVKSYEKTGFEASYESQSGFI